jgi:hypothetical protein
VRRSKLVATQSGTAAIGIQNSGSPVKMSNARANSASPPIATSTPIWTRSSRSRLWPNFLRYAVRAIDSVNRIVKTPAAAATAVAVHRFVDERRPMGLGVFVQHRPDRTTIRSCS